MKKRKTPASKVPRRSQQAPPPVPQPVPASPLVTTLREKLVNVSLVAEKGMQIEPRNAEWNRYRVLIDELGWQKFVVPPMMPYPAIVREFYANLPERTADGRVKVFGVTVYFGEQEINEHYDMPNIRDTRDMWLQHDDKDGSIPYNKIEHVLSLGIGLKMRRWENKTIYSSSLCPEGKTWRRFIQRRIFGIHNETDMTINQQKFLFLMITGAELNVGRYIWKIICDRGNSLKDGKIPGLFSLPFPSLITEMCLQQRVPAPANGYQERLAPTITSSTIKVDHNPTLRDFFLHHWGDEDSDDWVEPQIVRPPGDPENRIRGIAETSAAEEMPVEPPFFGEPQHPESFPPTFETTFGQPPPDPSVQFDTAGPSQPPPSYVEPNFWEQPSFQSYMETTFGRMLSESEQRTRQNIYESEQRQTLNMRQQDQYWLQFHMQRLHLQENEVAPPPSYDWPPGYGPPPEQ